MNEIEMVREPDQGEIESIASLELRSLLADWQEGKDTQTQSGRITPRYFGHYFQTMPMGMN